MKAKKSSWDRVLFSKLDYLQDSYNALKYLYSLDIAGIESVKEEMNRLNNKRFDMESDEFFKRKLKILNRKNIIKDRIKETADKMKVVKKELKENLELWAKQ